MVEARNVNPAIALPCSQCGARPFRPCRWPVGGKVCSEPHLPRRVAADAPKALFVVAAAIKRIDTGTVYTLDPPARHADVIRKMVSEGVAAIRPEAEQGFLLSDGRFARRRAAEHVAREAGQLTGKMHGPILTSEDLW
jgi:hypothetical protein